MAIVQTDTIGTEQSSGSGVTSFNCTGSVSAGLFDSLLTLVLTFDTQVTGTAVTWNGVPMISLVVGNTTTPPGRIEMWGLYAPASGSHTAAISWTGAAKCKAQLISWENVNPSLPLQNGVVATGTDNNPRVTINSTSGDAVLAAFAGAGASGATISSVNGNSLFIDNAGSSPGASCWSNGSASVTLAGIESSTDFWVAGGLDIVQSPITAWAASANLAGSGALAVNATNIPSTGFLGNIPLAGVGRLSIGITQVEHGSALLSGVSSLSANTPQLDQGVADLPASGAIINIFVSKTCTVANQALAASGSLAVHAEVLNSAALAAVGTLSCDAQYVARPVVVSTADRHVRRGADDYTHAMASLLPRGPAWPRQAGSVMMTALGGLMQVFGFFDGRAADLLEIESDPRTTVELLPDWERNFGLPDACAADEQLSISDRQIALVQKMTTEGGQSRAFFIAAAARIGYTITISEYAPFMAGVSQCGDTRNAQGDYRWQIGPDSMRFYWTVHVGLARLTWFRASVGQAGVDPMLIIGLATDLECLLRRWKPAQTEIVFDYSGLVSGGAFAGTP